MRHKYDPSQPIESLYDQIEDAVTLAAAGQAPYTTPQIVSIAYTLVFNTSLFPDACREWRRRPIADHTWVNFKTTFTIAHQELRESQVTSEQAGYHNANAAMEFQQDTAIALANLATANASDRSTVSNLSETNSNITNDLALANTKLAKAISDIASLQFEIAGLRGSNANSSRSRSTPNTSYCWTHGYRMGRNHDSTSCRNPSTGHKKEATRTNNMSGSQQGK